MTKRTTKTTARKTTAKAAPATLATAAGIIRVNKGEHTFAGRRAKLFALVRNGMDVETWLKAAIKATKLPRNKVRFELRHLRNAGAVEF